MPVFELILYIMAAVVLSSFLERFIPKVALPLVQIAMGIILAILPFSPNVTFEPNLFMIVVVAPLLYFESREINKLALLSSMKYSVSLAVGLVFVTMCAVAIVIPAIWPFVPLTAALVLGAALGPTDAVAVSALANEVTLSRRQFSTLQGESLFNDATGIVGFQFAVFAAASGAFEIMTALQNFTVKFIGGIALGAIVGLLSNWVFEKIRFVGWETTRTRILMELSVPFLLYMGAERMGVSGMLALVIAGLTARFDRSAIGPNVSRTNIVAGSVWSVLTFGLNGAVFLLLGMSLPQAVGVSWNDAHVSNKLLVAMITVTVIVTLAVRFIWMALMVGIVRVCRRKQQRPNELRSSITVSSEHDENKAERICQGQSVDKQCNIMPPGGWHSALVMTLGGAKGTLTLALMLTLPMNFPLRNELIFIASVVIIVTLLMANFLLPLAAPKQADMELEEVTPVVIEVLRRTVEELTSTIDSENQRALLAVIRSYTERIERMKIRVGKKEPRNDLSLQISALEWEKEYLKEWLKESKELAKDERIVPKEATGKQPAEILNDKMADGVGGNVQRRTTCADTIRGNVHSISYNEAKLDVEACERLLDQIMNSLRHIHANRRIGSVVWHIKGRFRATERRALLVARRLNNIIRKNTPMLSEDLIFSRMRRVQIDAMEHVIERLYRETYRNNYDTEHCSALMLEY